MSHETEVTIPLQRWGSSTRDTLRGTYFTSDNLNSTVQTLFIHGLGSSRSGYKDRATTVAESGGDALTFQLSSPGLPQKEYLTDVVAAYDWLRSQNEERKFAVCGSSYGAFLAVLLSTIRNVDHLLLRAPVIARAQDEAKVKTALNHFSGSLWLVLSELDESNTSEITEPYWESAKNTTSKEKITIPNADHSLRTEETKHAFLDILKCWIQNIS